MSTATKHARHESQTLPLEASYAASGSGSDPRSSYTSSSTHAAHSIVATNTTTVVTSVVTTNNNNKNHRIDDEFDEKRTYLPRSPPPSAIMPPLTFTTTVTAPLSPSGHHCHYDSETSRFRDLPLRQKMKWWAVFVVFAIVSVLSLALGFYFGLKP
jgi:hypothetical protein